MDHDNCHVCVFFSPSYFVFCLMFVKRNSVVACIVGVVIRMRTTGSSSMRTTVSSSIVLHVVALL